MSSTILITGASAGFGAAMARRFIRDGHRVIGAARRADRLEAMQGELGNAFLPFALDVTDAAAAAALPDALPEGWREVDVLVNNAGLALGLDPAFKAKRADWDQMMQVNVVGLVHLTHALLPGMVARNRGHVINLGSTAGQLSLSGRAYLRCEQGLRAPVQPQFALRSRGHQGARDRSRARSRRRQRIQRGALRRRRRARRTRSMPASSRSRPRMSPKPLPGCSACRRTSTSTASR